MADEPRYRDVPPSRIEMATQNTIDLVGMSGNRVAAPSSLGDVRGNYVGWKPTPRRELIEDKPKSSSDSSYVPPKHLPMAGGSSGGGVYARYEKPLGLPAGPKTLPYPGPWKPQKATSNPIADSFRARLAADAQMKKDQRNAKARERRAARKGGST